MSPHQASIVHIASLRPPPEQSSSRSPCSRSPTPSAGWWQKAHTWTWGSSALSSLCFLLSSLFLFSVCVLKLVHNQMSFLFWNVARGERKLSGIATSYEQRCNQWCLKEVWYINPTLWTELSKIHTFSPNLLILRNNKIQLHAGTKKYLYDAFSLHFRSHLVHGSLKRML